MIGGVGGQQNKANGGRRENKQETEQHIIPMGGREVARERREDQIVIIHTIVFARSPTNLSATLGGHTISLVHCYGSIKTKASHTVLRKNGRDNNDHP